MEEAARVASRTAHSFVFCWKTGIMAHMQPCLRFAMDMHSGTGPYLQTSTENCAHLYEPSDKDTLKTTRAQEKFT